MKIEAGKMRKLQINLFFVAKLLPFLLVFLCKGRGGDAAPIFPLL
jgi:hypothetical protein